MSIVEEIVAFNKDRLPQVLKIKYQAMLENGFRFYRGTCHLFYKHLSKERKMPISPIGWICGDLHLENFGSYRGNNKMVYFDLNDFDEATKAPVLWEVIRLITSILIAFQSLEIESEQAMNMVLLFIKSYATTLSSGKAVDLDPRTSKGIVCDFLKRAEKSSYDDLLKKRTYEKKGKLVLDLEDERHFEIDKVLKKELKEHITTWLKENNESPYNYKVKDVVYRIAGTGSLGQKRYLFLLKSINTTDSYLLIDMKQAFNSSLISYFKKIQPKWHDNADRITTVQRRMQHVSASLLSTSLFKNEDFVMQELQPVKDTIKFKFLKDNYRNMYQVIDDMAVLTASAQLRSTGVDGSATKDELIAFANQKEWKITLPEIAVKLSSKVFADYHNFKDACCNGDLKQVRLSQT